MTEEQTIIPIQTNDLVQKVTDLHKEGYRLVQINCTRTDALEINYSFDKNYQLVSLRLTLPAENPEIPSVSDVYWSAFLYENEMHDLYGVKVNGMAVDFQGKFYRTAVKVPFNCTPEEKRINP
jgi:ech hydrogenase subunit D